MPMCTMYDLSAFKYSFTVEYQFHTQDSDVFVCMDYSEVVQERIMAIN